MRDKTYLGISECLWKGRGAVIEGGLGVVGTDIYTYSLEVFMGIWIDEQYGHMGLLGQIFCVCLYRCHLVYHQQQDICVLRFDTHLHEKDFWKFLSISCKKLKPEYHSTTHCKSPLEDLCMKKERKVTYYVHEIPLVRSFYLEMRHFG